MTHLFTSLFVPGWQLSTSRLVLLALLGALLFANQLLVQRALRMAVEHAEASVAIHAELSGIDCATAHVARWPNEDAPDVHQAMRELADRRTGLEARLESLVAERQRLEQMRFPLLGL